MKVTLPQNDQYHGVSVTVKHPKGVAEHAFDDSHKEADFALPGGVHQDDVEVTAQFLTSGGKAVGDVILLKEARQRPKPAPAPKPEPKPEVKPAPTKEPQHSVEPYCSPDRE